MRQTSPVPTLGFYAEQVVPASQPMTSTITPHTASPCFQLKGSMVTMMTLELYRFDEASLHQQLQGLVAKAPRFFENTPVVVGLEHLTRP